MFAKTVGKSIINTKEVSLVLRIAAQVEYVGKATGRHYLWYRAGDSCLVDEQDAPDLLKKRLGKRFCCGNHNNDNNMIFEIAT